MIKKEFYLIIIIVLQIFTISVFGARPFAVDDAGLVADNQNEVESGIMYNNEYLEGIFEIKHGITEHLDLGANVGIVKTTNLPLQYYPLCISLKYGLIPSLLSFSLGATFNDPVWNANLILSKSLNSYFSFHTNIGMEVETFSSSGFLTYGILFTFNIDKIVVGGEMVGTNKEIDGWLLGLQWMIRDWVALDVGVSGTFNKNIDIRGINGLWFSF